MRQEREVLPGSPGWVSGARALVRRLLDEVAAEAERERLPLATYRVQLHRGFTFDDAAAIVPYLRALGVSDLYTSPYLKAAPGSNHGYDVLDRDGRPIAQFATADAQTMIAGGLMFAGTPDQVFEQLVDFTQKLLPDSEVRREQFFAAADRSSPEKWQASTQPQRDHFWDEVIGKLPAPTMPLNVRTRLIYDEPRWKGYEITLDLYPDVFAYGVLLVPKDLKPGEKRPVVVCQHGLEGRPGR